MRSTSGYPTRIKALDAARVEQAKALADTAAAQSEPPQWNAEPEGKELTLAEWFDRIWQSWDIELTTRANYSAPIRRFILPAFGSWPLSSITREVIDQWERVLVEERGYSVEYIRGARSRLHTILADAVAAGHLAVNPAARRRGRGRKASQERARASAEKIWATENTALLVAERCGLLGGAEEFVRTVVIAATGMRWGEVNGLQASYVRRPDQRRSHHYIRVEWQLIELNGKFYLAPPKDGSRRDIDIPAWLFDLIHTVIAHARRCRCPLNDDGTSACGSTEEFVFLGSRAGHARRSNYATRIFRPACDGIFPAEKRRRGYETKPWRVHCTWDGLFPGVPVPTEGRRRAKVEELADCSWTALIRGLTPHGLRHGHQTSMRRDRVPRVLRRERLGHGPSGDISDHYTHIDNEMTDDMLTRQTRRWEAAIAARVRIDAARSREPHSAIRVLNGWLNSSQEQGGKLIFLKSPISSAEIANQGQLG
jgi:integrase